MTVPVETPQPTPTDTETVPEGDIVAQAMEQIITPEEWQQLVRATPRRTWAVRTAGNAERECPYAGCNIRTNLKIGP